MILLIYEAEDASALKVISQLIVAKANFVSLSENLAIDRLDMIKVTNEKSSITFVINNKIYSIREFSVVWFRRANFIFSLPNLSYIANKTIGVSLKEHLDSEIKCLSEYIYDALESNCFVLGNPLKFNVNKLIVLEKAKECGLMIPDTLVSRSRDSVRKELGLSCLSKTIQDGLVFSDLTNKRKYIQKTIKVDFKKFPKSFYYSLFYRNFFCSNYVYLESSKINSGSRHFD